VVVDVPSNFVIESGLVSVNVQRLSPPRIYDTPPASVPQAAPSRLSP
jgi:hypothetical protein